MSQLKMQNDSFDLPRAMVQAIERERRLFAEDLHQTTSQNLVALLFGVERLARLIHSGKSIDSSQVDEVVQLARHSSEETRSLISKVSPLRASPGGLVLALGNLADSTSKKIPCEFVCEKPIRCERLEQEEALLSIAREAIRNALQHSGAAGVYITLIEQDDRLVLTVRDNGCGFQLAEKKSQITGISMMRCHAAAAGGELEIESKPGVGSSVRCTIPK